MRRLWVALVVLLIAAGVLWWRRQSTDPARNADLRLIGESTGTDEARVSLRALNRGGDVVTVIGEIRYDATVLRLKNCVSDGARAGKQFHFLEPEPGRVRTVLAGSLEPMPPESDVVTCTFAIERKGGGRTVVRASGEVADLQFVDRPFELSQEISLEG